MDTAALIDRLVGRLDDGRRIIVGLAGAPGAGKSTAAAALVAEAERRGIAAALVPMDGFHLADVSLDRLGLRDRKGAIETFDGAGYVALLRRLREEAAGPHAVYAPGFERDLEQPIAAAIGVGPEVRLVVTEGNYLLVDAEPWCAVGELLDETWFVEVDPVVRRQRLVERHVAFGKAREAAIEWVARVDEPNAERVQATRARATLVISS